MQNLRSHLNICYSLITATGKILPSLCTKNKKIMTTIKTLMSITLSLLLTTTAFSQDYLAFTALESEGYGAFASGTGHTIPVLGVCGLPTAYNTLVSADQAPSAGNGFLKLAAGGTGFTNFVTELTNNNYTLNQVDMKFTNMTLGNDIQGQDWFAESPKETRFYQNGTFTFFVNGNPIVSGDMPIIQVEIDYATTNCSDDIISGVSQYTELVDASVGQTPDIQAIAAALLADVGNRGIRLNFSTLEPAVQGTPQTGAIFSVASGKIELGPPFDDFQGITLDGLEDVCISSNVQVTSTGSGNWLHIKHNSDRICSILDSENMGIMTANFYINPNNIRITDLGLEYMDRNFTITPTTQPSTKVRVRLYFTSTEWTDFLAANPNGLFFMSDINITKFGSSDCEGMNNATNEQTLYLLEYGYLPAITSYYIDFNVTSFSTFFIHGPKAQNVLPVDLTAFSGRKIVEDVRLNWTTASEVNNAGFEVQKSVDGENWQAIGWVDGEGSSTEIHHYTYLDTDAAGTIYYRLKQIDFDGQFEYSKTIVIHSSANSDKNIKIYPTLVDHQITIERAGASTLQIINATGHIVRTISTNNTTDKITIDCRNLPQGMYWLSLSDGIRQHSSKFIKL